MTKVLKISLIILVILLTLSILAGILIGSLVNTEAFKAQMTQQVREQTGLTLVIEEALSFSVFPWLGFKTGKITLSQPAGIDAQNLVEISAADIGVKLLPLLQKKIEAGNIELKQPKFYYVVKDDGKTSLDAFTQTTNNASSNKQAAQNSKRFFSAITITGIRITDGQIIYDNQQENTRYTIDKLNIETGNLLATQAAPFIVSAHIQANAAPLIHIQTEGKAQFDIKNENLKLNRIELAIREQTHSLSSSIKAILFDSKKQTLLIDQLFIHSQLEDLNPQLSIPAIDINLKERTTSQISFSINEPSSNAQVSGQLIAKDWHTNPMAKGHIKSNAIQPLELAKKLGISYRPSDPDVLKSLTFTSHFSGTTKGFSLHSIKTTLDKTIITGDGSLSNFDKPHYRFDLNIDSINLDQYLPKTDKTENAKKSSNAGLVIAAPIPVLRDTLANGMVRVGQLQANGAKLSQLIVGIQSSNKQVIIKPKAQLYGGSTEGIITFTEKEQQASININNQLNNVDIEPLLIDTGISDQIAGRATIKMDITALEKNKQQENKGLINIAIKEGALKGIDVKKILDDTQDKLDELRGKATEAGKSNEDDKTRFTDMTATLHLKNNVITNKDLNIKAPAFRIGGKGKIELEAQTIDYLSDITIVNTNEGQGGKERGDLKGAVIPVHFFGNISAPEYKVDTRAFIKKNTEKAVDKKKEELKEKLKEKLFEELFK